MDTLYDLDGNPVQYTPEQLPSLLASGKYGFSGGTQAFVRPDTQEVMHVPVEHALTAFNNGLQWLGNGAWQKQENEKKYGTPLELAKTAAQEALGGATLDLSTRAAVNAGLTTPEAVQGRREANPNLTTASQVTGMVAPALVGEEAGLLGGLAKASPTSLVSAAAHAVVPAAESGLGRVAAAAARGALELPVYNAAAKADEALIQDKPLTASLLLDGAGESAQFGGLLGGGMETALGLAGKYVPRAFEKAANRVEWLGKKLEAPTVDAPGAIRDLSRGIAKVNKSMDQLLEGQEGALRDMVDQHLTGRVAADAVKDRVEQVVESLETPRVDVQPAQKAVLDHVTQSVDNANMVRREMYERIIPTIAEDNLGARLTQKDASLSLLDPTAKRAAGETNIVEEAAKHWDQGGYGKAQELLARAESALAGAQSDAGVFNTLRNLKRDLSEMMPKVWPVDRKEILALESIQRVNKELDRFTKDTARFGKAAEVVQDVDRAYARMAEGKGSGRGFKEAFVGRGLTAGDEKKIIRDHKVNKFLSDYMKSGGQSQIAKAVLDHGENMARFMEVVAKHAPADPLAKTALNTAGQLRQFQPVVEATVNTMKEAKRAAATKLDNATKDVIKVSQSIAKVAETGTDAEVFHEIQQGVRDMAQKLATYKQKEVTTNFIDQLKGMLADGQLFGDVGEHYGKVQSARDTVRLRQKGLIDSFLHQQGRVTGHELDTIKGRAAKPVSENADKVQKFVKGMSVDSLASDKSKRMLQEYVDTARESLPVFRETYEKYRGGKGWAGPDLHGNLQAVEDLASNAISVQRKANELEARTALKGRDIPVIGHLEGIASPLREAVAASIDIYRGRGSETISGIAKTTANVVRSWGESLDRFLNGVKAAPLAQVEGLENVHLLTPPVKGESKAEAYERIRGDLEQLGESGSLEMLEGNHPSLGRYAPETTKAVATTMNKIASVLLKTFPAPAPGAYQPPPTKAQIADLERNLATVTRPVDVLGKGLASGTITPAQVDMASQVHPELVGALQKSALTNAAGVNLNYSQQLGLSRLTGIPMAPGLGFVNPYQMMHKELNKMLNNRPHPQDTKIGKVNLSGLANSMSLDNHMSKRSQ